MLSAQLLGIRLHSLGSGDASSNASGLAARGYWDWDVYWSLQQIIPKYAPDILEAVVHTWLPPTVKVADPGLEAVHVVALPADTGTTPDAKVDRRHSGKLVASR